MKTIFTLIFIVNLGIFSFAQIELEQDIFPGPDASQPYALTEMNGKLYFLADDESGHAVFEYDGINPAVKVISTNLDYVPNYLAVYNDKLYFAADDGIHGAELWVYDGTETSMVADLYSGSAKPGFFAVYNDKLYFSARDDDYGREVFKYDGTSISIAADISPTDSDPAYLTVANDVLYFQAWSTGNGYELWQYNGEEASLAADINPGTSSSYPFGFFEFEGKLYFTANDGTNGSELWVHDGTEAWLLDDINPTGGSYPSGFTVYNDLMYYSCYDGTDNNIWSYDGESDPVLVAYISGGGFCVYRDTLFFGSFDLLTFDTELWAYDGIEDPFLYANINPDDASSPSYLRVFNDKMYFSADGGTNGAELWSLYIGGDTDPGVGISEEETLELSIYPNPSNGIYTIVTQDVISSVEIFGATGELILRNKTNAEIDLSNFAPGIYVAKISGDKGVITKQLILQ